MKLFGFIIILFSAQLTFGQETNEAVVISSGNTIINEDGSLDWIIGTNLIDVELELGLYQANEVSVPLQNEFIVYPTITSDWITIKRKIQDLETFNIAIINLSGHSELLSDEFSASKRLDLSKLSAGAYLVKVLNTNKQPVALFKIIKE